jgi:hypothetical protein
MVTNEQRFLIISIPITWNALLFALGIAFLEKRSGARKKRLAEARGRRHAEGRY